MIRMTQNDTFFFQSEFLLQSKRNMNSKLVILNIHQYISMIHNDWKQKVNKNPKMLTYKSPRGTTINIWIKQNKALTIRIQPQELIYKDIELQMLYYILKHICVGV